MPHRTDVVVGDVRPEYGFPLIGLGTGRPRLSWICRPNGDFPADWRQAGYEVLLTGGSSGNISSGRIDSTESVLVPWPFADLGSRERVRVQVRTWSQDRPDPTAYSPPVEWETGLLHPQDWVAVPIGPDWDEDPDTDHRPVLLRREFHIPAQVVTARLHVSSHGVHEIEINGRRVGRETLAPGWTSYHRRLRYRTHDVTALVGPGAGAVGAWLADGWYRGRYGTHGGNRNLYGQRTALIAQLEIDLVDGRRLVVATGPDSGVSDVGVSDSGVSDDGGPEGGGSGRGGSGRDGLRRDGHGAQDPIVAGGAWRAAYGPILASSLYEGETYDGRLAVPAFSGPGFDDRGWAGVRVHERDPATLVAAQGPPVRCTQELLPVAVLSTPSGRTVLDFGQNLAGRVRIRVQGPPGRRVRLRHAEVLQDGEVYLRPLQTAVATDTYVLSGDGVEDWEPRFTLHGFRYVEVEGWPGRLHEGDVVARVHHSDLRRTGWFSCSDPRLERLHENVVWSMRSNFVDLPTDCPQRDERLGWTGDIQVFGPTAAFLYDVGGFLASWLSDLAVEQLPDGTVPWYVPMIPAQFWYPPTPGALWGDTAVLLPDVLYQRYGDVGLLHRQYDSARRWVDLVEAMAGPERIWTTGTQLGDWLDPTAPPDDPAAARTDRHLVATAYFARSARVLAQIAQILGEPRDAQRYRRLARQVRDAFNRAYLMPDGGLVCDSQTAYALAIVFGLLPEPHRLSAGRRLAELVTANGNRVGTGFAGVNLVADALSLTGQDRAAWDLLTGTECPSWLYQVGMGATTIWERWDSMLPDGRVNPGEMTSFNHYALGSVADWMHRVVAGLAPAAPGYRRLLIRPRPGPGLRSAQARHETPYGVASVSWSVDADRMVLDVRVPLGVSARIDLPGAPVTEIGSGTHRFETRVDRPHLLHQP